MLLVVIAFSGNFILLAEGPNMVEVHVLLRLKLVQQLAAREAALGRLHHATHSLLITVNLE